MSTLNELLKRLTPRLKKRCLAEAAASLGIDPEELCAEVLEIFVKEAPRWFQRAPQASLEAQASVLLKYCFLRARRKARNKKKKDKVIEKEKVRENAEPSADATRPTYPGEMVMYRTPEESEATAWKISELLRNLEKPTPPQTLCLLSLKLCAMVVEKDAQRAKEWKKGGSNAVPRDIDDAWRIFIDGRKDETLVADGVKWKDRVGLAWYTEGPMENVKNNDQRNASKQVESYSNKALQYLREILKSQKVERYSNEALLREKLSNLREGS